MKGIRVLITAMSLLLGCKVMFYTNNNHFSESVDYYKVFKIDSINSYYLIYAEKDDTLYKIVSEKGIESDCNSIQVNQSYPFKLTSRRDNAVVINGVKLSPQNYLDIECYVYDDSTSICIERDSIYDLHHASNIKGLCFQSE